MRAPESLIPVLEQLCTVLEQLCRVEADKLTVVSADHPDQLESLLNDENMLLLQLRGLDKKRSDLLRRSGLEGLTFRQILMQEDSEEAVALLSPILERLSSQAEKAEKDKRRHRPSDPDPHETVRTAPFRCEAERSSCL